MPKDVRGHLIPGRISPLRPVDASIARPEYVGKPRPAKHVGGDVYDFLTLPDGRVAVVLGDVTGHGVDATADMAMAKYVFRSLARLYPEPADFLGAANWDAGHSTKIEVIQYVLDNADPYHPVMVGDRIHDFAGAAEFGLPSIAVTWGYGAEEEWEQATYVAHTSTELEDLVREYC